MTSRVLLASALAAACLTVSVASAELVTPRVSPKVTLTQTLGVTDITLVYSRPGVRGRRVWGELVPWDKPWRTGANEATTFTCSTELTVNGQKLPAGTYGFFTIPNADEWTVVFSKQKDLWGTNDYDPAQDQLRVKAKPMAAEYREWMELGFEDLTPAVVPQSPSAGKLVLRWEKVAVPVTIETDMTSMVLAAARDEMAKRKADDWRTPFRAASFVFDNEVAASMTDARAWLATSVKTQENFQNLSLLARMQAKEGKKKDALATAAKAVKIGKASKEPVDTAATEKLIAEWSAKK
jgi:Protein of unknown function (DUF2911)